MIFEKNLPRYGKMRKFLTKYLIRHDSFGIVNLEIQTKDDFKKKTLFIGV
jgi:hypothetical protein